MIPLDAYTRQTENGGKTRRRIFRMLASGLSVKEIAFALGRSQKTIQYHWHYIKKMLGVKLPTELIWIALKRRWSTATGKWIKSFMCLSMVTSALAVDQPPVLPKIYKPATGIGQGSGSLQLLSVTPPPQQVILSWTSGEPVAIQSSTDLKVWATMTNASATQSNLAIPSNLKVSFFRQYSLSGNKSATISWLPSPTISVTGYRIYYGYASRTYTNVVDAGNFTNVTVSNLVQGATYYFAATAYNTVGESDYSNEVEYRYPISLLGNIRIRVI